MSLFTLTKPFLHALDPETAHGLTIKSLKTGLMPKQECVNDPKLRVALWDRIFPNPVGLAAGFDKNADVIGPMLQMGFGFVETGTVTPKAQSGNPRPRIFRDRDNESVINRMGFPNQGLNVFKANIERFLEQKPRPPGIVGINIGMNKNQTDPAKDYCHLIRDLGPYADYFTINISSPNTPGLRNLQDPEHLAPLLEQVSDARRKFCGKQDPPPLLVKLSPDIPNDQVDDIAKTILDSDIDGIILTNTTLERPDELPDKLKNEAGGLSGQLLTDRSTAVIRRFYKATNGAFPIIGVGGISSGQQAYEKIRAGASLIQLYSALVYQGPELVAQINRDLLHLLERDGLQHISDAVGLDNKTPNKTETAHAG